MVISSCNFQEDVPPSESEPRVRLRTLILRAWTSSQLRAHPRRGPAGEVPDVKRVVRELGGRRVVFRSVQYRRQRRAPSNQPPLPAERGIQHLHGPFDTSVRQKSWKTVAGCSGSSGSAANSHSKKPRWRSIPGEQWLLREKRNADSGLAEGLGSFVRFRHRWSTFGTKCANFVTTSVA